MLDQLITATWQGLVGLAIAWAICRFVPRLPTSYRQAIWWIACLKLVAGLLPTLAIRLPWTLAESAFQAHRWTPNDSLPTTSKALNGHESPAFGSILAGTWLAGVVLGLVWLAVEAVRSYRLLRRSGPVAEIELAETCRVLAAKAGLRRPPRLLRSSEIASPMVMGLLRPTILIPEKFASGFSSVERELALSHEIAHISRADLLTGWIPMLAKILFWFLPPVHWAVREWEVEREAACDAEALALTQMAAPVYGRLLLSLVAKDHHRPMPSALGATAAFHTLKRRLTRLGTADRPVPMLGLALPAALCLPWTLVAAPGETGQLTNAGIEEGFGTTPRDWKVGEAIHGVRYKWDRTTGHSGSSSLCIEKTENRYFPIASWSQKIPSSPTSKSIEVSAWIKADRMSKAVLDVQFYSEDGIRSHEWVAYIGARSAGDAPATHGWKRLGGVVAIPPGVTEIAVAPQVYGPGKVWFDDLSARFTNQLPTAKENP